MSEPERQEPWYQDWKNLTIAGLAALVIGISGVVGASALDEQDRVVTLAPGEAITVSAQGESSTTTEPTQPTEPTTTEPTTTTEPPPTTTTEPPPTTTTTEPPTETEPPPTDYDLVLVDRQWICDRAYQNFSVRITITGAGDRNDAAHLNAGCSGSIRIEAMILKGWDCVKVHQGAANLTVTGFCEIRDRVGDVHQDMVQAMGGTNVTFSGFETRTAKQPGWNGGGGPGSIHSSFFVNEGAGGQGRPVGIVCDGCVLAAGGSPVWVNEGTGSGARNSSINRGATGRCVTITASAIDGVNENNSCIG